MRKKEDFFIKEYNTPRVIQKAVFNDGSEIPLRKPLFKKEEIKKEVTVLINHTDPKKDDFATVDLITNDMCCIQGCTNATGLNRRWYNYIEDITTSALTQEHSFKPRYLERGMRFVCSDCLINDSNANMEIRRKRKLRRNDEKEMSTKQKR